MSSVKFDYSPQLTAQTKHTYGNKSNNHNFILSLNLRLKNFNISLFFFLFFRYIYSEQLELVSVGSAFLLYDAGEMYDLPQLKKLCEDYIVANITVSDVCFLYNFLKLHNNINIEKNF